MTFTYQNRASLAHKGQPLLHEVPGCREIETGTTLGGREKGGEELETSLVDSLVVVCGGGVARRTLGGAAFRDGAHAVDGPPGPFESVSSRLDGRAEDRER